MKRSWWKQESGFTVVELLIVIVVIGILATITIVGYNGMQARANDSRRDSDIRQVQTALELYKLDYNTYPAVCSADGSGCTLSNLSSALSPTYMAAIPKDPKSPTTDYQYVKSGTSAYGILIYYNAKPTCKTGVNIITGWWGSSVPTC